MRNPSKLMIALLAGATVLTPIAAQAQEQDRSDRRGGTGRSADEHGGGYQRGGPDRGDAGARMPEARQPAEARPAETRQVSEPRATPPVTAAAPAARNWNRADDSRRVAPPQRDPSVGVARGVYDRRQPDRPTDARRDDDRNDRHDWNNGRDDHRDGDRDNDHRDWNNGRDGNRDWNRDNDRHDWNRDGRNDGDRHWSTDRRDWNDRDSRDDRRWNRDWRNDRRYSWQDYRSQNRNIYRVPRYSGRSGYSYRRWSPGYRFDPFYYGSSFWIDDPFYYRLPPAYGDYRWVRYYDDVALVDIRTGLIVDIIYSFFLR